MVAERGSEVVQLEFWKYRESEITSIRKIDGTILNLRLRKFTITVCKLHIFGETQQDESK